LMIGAIFLERLAAVLMVLMAMVFIGGLTRLTALDAALLLSPKIAPSLFIELFIFPLLGFWIYQTTQKNSHD